MQTRAATLNKDVLSQADGLVAMRVTAPQDRDAIREWVRGQGDEERWSAIAPSLPGLANGESWWWIPEKAILQQVTVRHTDTFDSSPTRRRGEARRSAKTFADVDLAAISERISASIERAKQTDPRELRRRVAQLEADLAAARAAAPAPRPEEELQAVARLQDAGQRVAGIMQALQAAQATFDEQLRTLLAEHSDAVRRTLDDARDVIQSVQAAAPAPTNRRNGRASRTDPQTSPSATAGARPVPAPASTVAAAAGNGKVDGLVPARQRLLNALAMLESIGVMQVGKTQLALWADTSPKSSGYANNLGAMRSAGLINYPGPATVALTDDGRTVADTGQIALATDEDLHRHVQHLVPPARWRIIHPLIQAYPNAVVKADLADLAGVSVRSSGFANNLGALKSMGLIDYPQPGMVAAAPTLFLHPVT